MQIVHYKLVLVVVRDIKPLLLLALRTISEYGDQQAKL